ncbi:type I-MYXAN CRISPR-associated endonuclease Cas1 [bacterium]|nr:type I-MYXAN CRISPR-associated endonuclease Cas1 [bacterium]
MLTADRPLTRVMALHAIAYCERLFYLEEVEEIRLADANVFAGRRLHEELAEDETVETLSLEDEELGLIGKMDAIRNRDGLVFPYEHKRGRSKDDCAWEPDEVQVAAYALLLEKHLGKPVTQARIRYHRNNKTVIVPITPGLKQKVNGYLERGHQLRQMTIRPPITDNENKCIRCSLSPVCLPEETRKAKDEEYESIRLFPPKPEKQTIHLLGHGDKLSRQGETLKVMPREGDTTVLPAEDIGEVCIHGYAQASTQAIALCAYHDIPLHWFTSGGKYLCALSSGVGKVQRRINQFQHLADPAHCLVLAKQTVNSRMENQIQFLMRLSRGNKTRRDLIVKHLKHMRRLQKNAKNAASTDSLRGFEGSCGNTYFSALRILLDEAVPEPFRFKRRTRRPPLDRFNAILSFGYSLLYRSVINAILQVGLEPSLGYYHRPRSAAHPLVMDVMELFRVPLWDQPVVASIRRNRWDADQDFEITKAKVWLSDDGRKKAIELFENRLNDEWKHPVLDYSLSYGRQIELEVRLLEKWWTEEKSLFATSKIR